MYNLHGASTHTLMLCFNAGSEYHQYDFFVYPEATRVERGYLSQAWEASKGFFSKYFINIQGSSVSEDEFTPLSSKEMVKQCLFFYLQPYQEALVNETSYTKDFTVDGFVQQVKRIFEKHHTPVVQHGLQVCPVRIENLKQVRTRIWECLTL